MSEILARGTLCKRCNILAAQQHLSALCQMKLGLKSRDSTQTKMCLHYKIIVNDRGNVSSSDLRATKKRQKGVFRIESG